MALTTSACGLGPAGKPDNFGCAAMLAAYTHAVRDGDIVHDEVLTPQAYMAVMFHLNAWAMPQDIREPEAFAQINAEADRIRANSSPEEIVDTACWCVENKPEY